MGGGIFPTLVGVLLLLAGLISTIMFMTNICLCCCINKKVYTEKKCKIYCGLITFFLIGKYPFYNSKINDPRFN